MIDLHVHLREPGGTHKEDWATGTASALAGGFTMVLAMPNTKPPVTDARTFDFSMQAAAQKAHCDYAQYIGASSNNHNVLPDLAPKAAGLKLYLDQTYGALKLDKIDLWMNHLTNWPRNLPIAAHAEGASMAAIILIAALCNRSVHICHISRREEILLIKAAKERGFKVTCEVTPHHLLLSQNDVPSIGVGKSEVRPRLASPSDRQALWDNLDVIDCIATDHAPPTISEKTSSNPPPGFPGLETAIPLLLTEVHRGVLTMESLVTRLHTNPKRIFNLPEQQDTYIDIDKDIEWEIHTSETFTKCGWTPYEGWKVRGGIQQVVLRGKKAYQDGKIFVKPGFGRNIRAS
jgi:carbamoyl-phosphate synthase/aspartate carbamoyltransferase/dihydroorotase